MTNDDVVRFLETIADTLEIKGERPYRIRAYREAARQVDVLEEDMTAIAADRRLTTIPRVGASLAARMQEFIEPASRPSLPTSNATHPLRCSISWSYRALGRGESPPSIESWV